MTSERSFDIVIAGGGTAGVTVAAQLRRARPEARIAVVEPSESHWYQPLWTLVGGGAATLASTRRPEADVMPSGVTWLKERVIGFRPRDHAIDLASGAVTYRALVVAIGIHVDWDAIPGLKAALDSGRACSNYSEKYVESTWAQLQAFTGGPAIFTFPATPIKCAGAPQKIMYLADDTFRRRGVREQARVVFATAGEKIFGVKKYADALTKVVERRGIETKFKHNLVALDGVAKVATFELVGTGQRVNFDYGLIHVTPPMRAPDVAANSDLANAAGWVDVDKSTLQHVRFPDVFSLGDVSSLPTSKTGAAVRAEAPVLVKNLLAHLDGKALDKKYDGYTSCPLVTGYGKLILAEFDYDGTPRETFPFDQSKERLSMYLLKKYGLPALYWNGMLKGRA